MISAVLPSSYTLRVNDDSIRCNDIYHLEAQAQRVTKLLLLSRLAFVPQNCGLLNLHSMFIRSGEKPNVSSAQTLETSNNIRRHESVEMSNVRCSIWIKDRRRDIVWFRRKPTDVVGETTEKEHQAEFAVPDGFGADLAGLR